MSDVSYTVIVYKTDKRTKIGKRQVRVFEHKGPRKGMKEELTHLYQTSWFAKDGYSFEIHETYVTRKNLMTGQEYEERYDTPRSCSPSSESFWSN
jgi:hypothetical protein